MNRFKLKHIDDENMTRKKTVPQDIHNEMFSKRKNRETNVGQ